MQDVFRVTSGATEHPAEGRTHRTANEAVKRPNEKSVAEKVPTGDVLKDWFTVILLLVFVLFYSLAFAGKLDPLKDNSMLLRFEPIIFILVGYYFGCVQTRHGERFFQDEIARQVQRADAAQFAKEKAQQERDALEERMRNARRALKASDMAARPTELKAIATTLKILDS